jgi:hypothetical protein
VSPAELVQAVTRLGGRVTLEAGKLRVQVPKDRPDLLGMLRVHKPAVLEYLANTGMKNPEPQDMGTPARNLPRSLVQLPFELEALIRAASNNSLPAGTVTLETGLCADLNRFVLAWGCSYLTGGFEDALKALWTAHKAWRVHLGKVLN